MRTKLALVFALNLLAGVAEAHDMKKCFGFTHKGMLRKYDFKYLAPTTHPSDSKNCSVPTDTTSKEGLSDYSTQNSTQGSTASVDPEVSTNTTTGQTQFTSSFGPCSMLGHVGDHKRDAFVASNWHALREEIAVGRGELLATSAQLSGCSSDVYDFYVAELRQRFELLAGPAELVAVIDALKHEHPKLMLGCNVAIGAR